MIMHQSALDVLGAECVVEASLDDTGLTTRTKATPHVPVGSPA